MGQDRASTVAPHTAATLVAMIAIMAGVAVDITRLAAIVGVAAMVAATVGEATTAATEATATEETVAAAVAAGMEEGTARVDTIEMGGIGMEDMGKFHLQFPQY